MLSISFRKQQKAIVIIFDQLIIYAAYLFSFLLRFDFKWSRIPTYYVGNLTRLAPIISLTTFLVFFLFKLYHIVWRYITVNDVVKILLAVSLSGTIITVTSYIMDLTLPVSVNLITWFGIAIAAISLRLMPKFFFHSGVFLNERVSKYSNDIERVMIIGGGNAGEMLLKDIVLNKDKRIRPILIVDDNEALKNRTIAGIPVLGKIIDIPMLAKKHKIDSILFAIPSANDERKREILEICNQTSCKLRMITGYWQMATSDSVKMELRDVTIEDLLGREPVVTDLKEVGEYLNNKVVLVTGGGGSIGSELCRQISDLCPKTLIIVDIYENNAYNIQIELKRNKPDLNLVVLIASVRDEDRMESIFSEYRPNVVFHAAAHKHVPLMEDSPMEAVKNNIAGTYKVATLADKYQVERFVMISTDKAVNPTNVMGASKRVCEMIIQSFGQHSNTNFVAVRFGNVLGSNGSVVPLFRKQIEEGGPITVTHPEIIRYFMIIPEAVSLVLQAGAYAKKGEIYVLDMGEPVKILDLATRMIRLSGYIPNQDIKIVFTGLRPGEKLYEEMLMSEEGLRKTPNKLIFIANPSKIDSDNLKIKLMNLIQAAETNNRDYVKEQLNKIVKIRKDL